MFLRVSIIIVCSRRKLAALILSSYPISMFKVSFSILISFIIQSLSILTCLFALYYRWSSTNLWWSSFSCVIVLPLASCINDKEISLCIISIDLLVNAFSSLLFSLLRVRTLVYMTKNNYLNTLYTYAHKVCWEEKEKDTRCPRRWQTSLIVH